MFYFFRSVEIFPRMLVFSKDNYMIHFLKLIAKKASEISLTVQALLNCLFNAKFGIY